MTLEHVAPSSLAEAAPAPFASAAAADAAAPRTAGAMTRARMALDGLWQFQFCGDAALPLEGVASWRTCVVPAPWQAEHADLRERGGRAWYRRGFDLPEDWA